MDDNDNKFEWWSRKSLAAPIVGPSLEHNCLGQVRDDAKQFGHRVVLHFGAHVGLWLWTKQRKCQLFDQSD